MMQLGEDLLPLLDACARGRSRRGRSRCYPGASVGVVLAAQGYPELRGRAIAISGLDAVPASSAGVPRRHADRRTARW